MTNLRSVLNAVAALSLVSCTNAPDFDDPAVYEAANKEPSCKSLLVNGDFDDGPGAWTSTPNESIRDENDFEHIDFLHASSGRYFLWLGGEYGVTRTISQTVAIPWYASSLRLSGRTIVASEAEDGPVQDTLTLQVLDAQTGALLETVLSWSNQNPTEGDYWSWRDLRVDIQGDYSGQNIVLRWTSVTDASENTNFLFDSLRLKTSDCR